MRAMRELGIVVLVAGVAVLGGCASQQSVGTLEDRMMQLEGDVLTLRDRVDGLTIEVEKASAAAQASQMAAEAARSAAEAAVQASRRTEEIFKQSLRK